jgi:hypothetical protein
MISLYSCAGYNVNRDDLKNKKSYFSSSGFALVYNDNLFLNKTVNKKINNDEIKILHNFLKPNTPIKIINPSNSKFIETKIYKKSIYPQIFSVVISKKVAQILDLNLEDPFIELIEIKKNKTFIAKKSNIFDEEKNVAETVPVNEVKMDDLSKPESINEKKLVKKNKFILVISDFYYKESATKLMSSLSLKTEFNNYTVKKINDNKYRLFAGPFKNFNALKVLYISLNELGFENLNVYKE